MDMIEKQKRILTIAQEDFSYTVWYNIFQESEKAFEAFAGTQPEEIQTILWNYAYSGRMMNQRLLNLACETMIFSKEPQ